MEPASETTSTSPTWPTPICWLSGLEARDRLIFNLGNGQGFSVRQVIESAAASPAIPSPPKSTPPPRRPRRPRRQLSESHPRIGLETRYTELDDIVRTAWLWHQKRYA